MGGAPGGRGRRTKGVAVTVARTRLAATVAVLLAATVGVQLSGCTAGAGTGATGPASAASDPTRDASGGVPSPGGAPGTSTTSPAGPTATASDTPALRPASTPVDDRSGKARNTPFTVNGIVVVSAEHPVGSRYTPELASGQPLAKPAARAFTKLQRAVRMAGLQLDVVSGYRSYGAQSALYNSRLASMGRAWTAKYVAKPGTSEHQTGLAVDLRSPSGRGTSFDDTREWRWLRRHAQDYGFVLRYPQGKTKITGIGFEPWHWRYVGVAQATAIRALGANVTIEEYLRLT